MPVFNSATRFKQFDFFSQAVETLLNQSFTSFELIMLDNQSSDETPERCQNFVSKDTRVRYVRDTEQRYPEGAIEELVRLARGKFCMIANDDDRWDPDYIKTTVALLEADPSAAMAYTNSDLIDEHGRRFQRCLSTPAQAYNDGASRFEHFRRYALKRNVIPFVFGLFRTEAYKALLPFAPFDTLKADVDNLLVLKFFLLNFRARYDHRPLFFYRHRTRRIIDHGIVDMPTSNRPGALWIYYVLHQLRMFDATVKIIAESDAGPAAASFCRLTALKATLRHSGDLLTWVRAEYAATHQNRQDLKVVAKNFDTKVLAHLSAEQTPQPYTHEHDPRMHPALLMPEWQKVNRATLGLMEVITQYQSNANTPSEILYPKETIRYLANLIQRMKQQGIVSKGAKEIIPIERVNEECVVCVIIEEQSGSSGRALQALKKQRGVTIRMYRMPALPGVASRLAALEKLLMTDTAETIVLIGPDDVILESDWLKTATSRLESNPELAAVWGLAHLLSARGGQMSPVQPNSFALELPKAGKEFFYDWLASPVVIPRAATVLRRSALLDCVRAWQNDRRPNDLPDWLAIISQLHLRGYSVAHEPRIVVDLLNDTDLFGDTIRASYTSFVHWHAIKLLIGVSHHVFRSGSGEPRPEQFSRTLLLAHALRPVRAWWVNKVNQLRKYVDPTIRRYRMHPLVGPATRSIINFIKPYIS